MPKFVMTGNFNGDAHEDLVVIHQDAPGDITRGAVSIMIADGLGGYATSSSEVIEGTPWSLTSADFDGDGFLDIGVGHQLKSSLTILLGDGSGGFRSNATIALSGSRVTLTAFAAAGDGVTDLAVVTSPGAFPGRLHVLRGNGDGTFVPGESFVTGVNPGSVATGDFNADGRQDIAVGHSQGLTVFIQGAMGKFWPGSETAPGTGVASIAVGDYDKDGILDLAVGSFSRTRPLALLRGNGTGGFTLTQTIPISTDGRSIDVCDVNGDGALDLVAAQFSRGAVGLVLGRGDGTFEPSREFATRIEPVDVAPGDLNGDGYCDFVSASQSDDAVSILLSDGRGSIGTPRYPVGGETPLDVTLLDLDGDGELDLATANRGTDDVSLLLGDGSGRFVLEASLQAGMNPDTVLAVDLDQDSFLDLAVANQGEPFDHIQDTLSLFYGVEAGHFGSQEILKVGHLPVDVVYADFDNDGILDLATADFGSETVSLLLGRGEGKFRRARRFRLGGAAEDLAVLDVDEDGLLDLAVSLNLENKIVFLMGHVHRLLVLSPRSLPGALFNVDKIVSADVNLDGRDDLLFLNTSFANEPGTVSVHLGDGQSWFTEAPGSGVETGAFPQALEVFDLDGSGAPDLAVLNRWDNSVRVYLGDGAGHFTPAGDFGIGRMPLGLTSGDVNGDGSIDLISADAGGNSVSVLLNRSGVACGAGVNRPIETLDRTAGFEPPHDGDKLSTGR